MEYFILNVDKEYIPPSLKGWYGKLDKNTLNRTKHYQLPKYMSFSSNDSIQTVYTDLIMHPCFMVSENMKALIELYEPFIRFACIILFSSRDGSGYTYYIPFLEEVDCLCEGSIYNLDKSVIYHAQVDKNLIGDKAIIRVAGVNHSCILVREDFAESLLSRYFVGIGLRETEVV